MFTCQMFKAQYAEQVCIMNADGTGFRRLTTDDGVRHLYPSLAPDAGMLAGAALFAEAYPLVKTTILTWCNYGKISILTALGVGPWPVIAVITAGFLGLFWLFEKKGL